MLRGILPEDRGGREGNSRRMTRLFGGGKKFKSKHCLYLTKIFIKYSRNIQSTD